MTSFEKLHLYNNKSSHVISTQHAILPAALPNLFSVLLTFLCFSAQRVFEATKVETNPPNCPELNIAMAEEAPASESSVTMAAPEVDEAVAPNAQEILTSNEATIESNAQGGTESTCNNNDIAETSLEGDREKSLEFADQLMDRGSKAIKDNDLDEATECFSRALEIRFGFQLSIFIFLDSMFGCFPGL